MNDKTKVLSSEEMDALLDAAQDKGNDLTEIIGSANLGPGENRSLNQKALKNISELTWSECEKNLSSFLRKKILVSSKSAKFTKLNEALQDKTEKYVFTVFKIFPQNHYAVALVNLPLLHQAINYLFGGLTNDSGTVIDSPGKIGKIISEKLCQLSMDGFMQACKEYGNITYETVKTVTLPNLITKLSMEDVVFAMDLSVAFGEMETLLSIFVADDFFYELIPFHAHEMVTVDSESWRSAIQSQVVDSTITVSVSLPEVSMKASDLMSLKNGQLIPIGDPTNVYVCLNNKKLFLGTAGQANSNRVVKILNEI